ncbi:hypothetical protein OG949_16905 [Streptomyces scopuliridis]|uniref:hypothetical protein n=1 Tax=Streptomyces scopuliridis TaxID=452529 RepID=UPI002DDB4872|nr:hypothetical protein [Streptomyces scopuliridis]WSB34384.1 hypothetical protein OG949_16905 [Streptomyces scopuliridis]
MNDRVLLRTRQHLYQGIDSHGTGLRHAHEPRLAHVAHIPPHPPVREPGRLRGGEWIPASYPFDVGELPVALQLSARTDAASAMTERNAYFTAGVPHEAITGLLVTLDARERTEAGASGCEVVLTARNWFRDVDRPQSTATDPGFCSSVSLEMVPTLIQDVDPRPDASGWQAGESRSSVPRTCWA